MAISKLLSRLKKALGKSCVHEKPSVPPKFTTNTAEKHPHQFNETRVPAGEVDGGRKEAGRKKKKKWCSFLPLFCKRATEKYNKPPLYQNTVAGQTDDQISVQDICIIEIHDLQEAPISSSKDQSAEDHQEDHLVQTPVLNTVVTSSSDDDINPQKSLSANEDSAVKPSADEGTEPPTAVEDIEPGVSPTAVEDIEPGVSPTADEDIASVVSHTEDKDVESAVLATKDDVTQSVVKEEPHKNHFGLRYKVGAKLGEGGFGAVYEGICYQDGRPVAVKFALKTPHTTHLSVPFQPTPLPSEIALAVIANRGPSCPNIIQLLDWQDYPDRYIMVMERPLPSMDLLTYLQLSGGVLTEHTAQYIMWQAVNAANVCCYRGVFHRDIKLENILVNPNTLEVKLIDFGCGDLLKDSSYKTFSGTNAYCPPEYFESGTYHAKPATVYSLGVLLFTMLHGRLPTDYDMHLINNDWSKFVLSRECCLFMWSCLQQHPEHRLRLEHMHYHDWFLLNFFDQSHHQDA